MKKLLILAIVLGVVSRAQNETVEETTPFVLVFDYSRLIGAKIYTNGIFCQSFSTNEVSFTGSATNAISISQGLTNSYSLNMPGIFRNSTVSFTASVFDNGIESGQTTNLCLIDFRPRKAGNLKRFK